MSGSGLGRSPGSRHWKVWCWWLPTRIVCAHSHLFLTLHRGNQITIETESERARDCTQKFIKDKYTLFISTRATLLQRYLSAYNNDIVSNELFFFHSVSTSNGLQQIPCHSINSSRANLKRLIFTYFCKEVEVQHLFCIAVWRQAWKKEQTI